MISEVTIVLLVHGLSVLCGVFLGYKIAMRCVDMDLKYDNDIDIPTYEPEDISEPLLSKIFPEKFKKDKEEKFISPEDIIDNEKRHAFFD